MTGIRNESDIWRHFSADTRIRLTGHDPHSGAGIALLIEDGLISEIRPCDDAEDCWLGLGLLDIQVNGYAGIDLNDGRLDAASLTRLAMTLLRRGTTRFLPTLITASEQQLLDTLSTIASACSSDPVLNAMMPLIHVEGPFISPEDGPRGAHPIEHVRPPSLAEVQRWQDACDQRIGLITLSPHWDDSAAFIRGLCGNGIRVALGHTSASHEQISEAAEAGASLSTHLGNGIAASLPRHPNPLWTQLSEDRLHASFIADGHHLPAETLIAMLRAKGRRRSLLVSDSAALAGMPPGRYQAAIGGDVELAANGRLSVAGTPFLAGAARSLSENVALCATLPGLMLGNALDMACDNPGHYLGLAQTLKIGQPADLIQFDWQPGQSDLHIRQVIKAGRAVKPGDNGAED